MGDQIGRCSPQLEAVSKNLVYHKCREADDWRPNMLHFGGASPMRLVSALISSGRGKTIGRQWATFTRRVRSPAARGAGVGRGATR